MNSSSINSFISRNNIDDKYLMKYKDNTNGGTSGTDIDRTGRRKQWFLWHNRDIKKDSIRKKLGITKQQMPKIIFYLSTMKTVTAAATATAAAVIG